MALTDNQGAQVDADVTLDYAGVEAIPITLAGPVSKGDVLGYAAGWKRALATVGTAIAGRLIAGASGVTGDVILAYPACILRGTRISGATVGVPVYVAEGADNGEYTEVKPSTSGDVNSPVGLSLSATELYLCPMFIPSTVA